MMDGSRLEKLLDEGGFIDVTMTEKKIKIEDRTLPDSVSIPQFGFINGRFKRAKPGTHGFLCFCRRNRSSCIQIR